MKLSFSNLLLLILGLIAAKNSLSQSCANYSPVTRQTGITYTSIAASSPSYFIWRNTASNQNDDNRSYQVPIGFDFWYLGVRYNQISASLNGVVDFSTSTSQGNTPSGSSPYGSHWSNQFSTANSTMLALAPLYADLWTANGGTTAIATSIFYKVTGTSPNQVLTVEWLNFDHWNLPTNSPNVNYNFQVKIYENTGIIEFVYGTMTAVAGGSYPLQYACGINNNWTSGAPNATRLLTQQTANSTTFSSTAKNNLTTLPTSNSQLTFTPPTPNGTPPASLSFTGITSSGMTVNWTNWCTNEVGYAVYNSTDSVTFNFVAQTAANATSYAATGLLPSTLYYWRVYAVTDGALSNSVAGSQTTTAGGNKISITTGNWNTAGTWSPSGVPTSSDNVTIANGHTVTINSNAACNNLTVGQGTSGILQIGSNATARTVTINNNVTINAGGQFIANTASNTTHALTISGNITNNGTLNFATDGNSFANTTFNKNGNQTISGTGTTTQFNRITVNMGNINSNTLDITASNFTAVPTNFLTLTNGTFKLSSAATVTPFTANTTIPLTSGLWINNPSAIVNTIGGTITLYGKLTVSSGTLNIGNATNNNLTSYGGVVTFNGGSINIAGRLDKAGTPTLSFFNMTNGTLTLNTVGSTTAGAAPFRMDEIGATFNMTGGTIIVRRSGSGNLGYVNVGSTGTVTGGTLQIGDASTPAAQTIQINSTKEIGNLLINSANANAVLTTNNLVVANGISINAGSLNANNLNLTLGGNWLDAGTFTPGTGTVTFDGTNQSITKTTGETFNHLTLTGTGTKTLGGAITTNGNLTINTNAVLDVTTNNYAVTIKGNWTNNGNFLANSGTVTFNGAVAQTIGGTSITNFRNITLNNTAGATLTQAQNLFGTLTLSSGTFATNGQVFTLISDASGTARIATIPVGADITGNITMQRYIDAGATNWRFLTTATSGATLADWVDDFITSGFTGSAFPLWPSASNPWPNIYFYDETVLGIEDSGYVAATNATNSITVGQGVWAWSGDTITGTQPFTVDVTGPTNKGNISLPLTYTSSAGIFDDGWNMVGNPYPSTLDWDSPTITKTGVNNAIYIWNPDLEQFASYIGGFGSNGGSNNIASSQAFWVQTNAASPSVILTETSKTAVDGAFLKQNNGPLTFNVQNGYGTDQTIINFESNATNNFDALYDALKLGSTNPNLPYISSLIPTNSAEYSINQLPEQEINIFIKIKTGVSGIHNITISGITNYNQSPCLLLEDLFTGMIYDLKVTSSFSAYIYDTTLAPRFLLKFGAPIEVSSTNLSCFGSADGKITFNKNSTIPFDILWKNSLGDTILNSTNIIASDSITNLTADTYYIVNSDNLCGNSTDTVIVTEPIPITSLFNADADTVYLSNGGTVNFANQSINATNYLWDFGDVTTSTLPSPAHTYFVDGNYLVSLVASQTANCSEIYSKIITVLITPTNINEAATNDAIKAWISSDILTIDLKNNNYSTIEIRNVLGQLVYSNHRNLIGTFSLDVSKLKSSVFMITLTNATEVEVIKIPYIK